MQTRSSVATGRSGSWSSASGRFVCFAFLLCCTITPALAGVEGHGVGGFAVQHDNRTGHISNNKGLRVGVMPNAIYRRPLAAANREMRETQNNVVRNPTGKIEEAGRGTSAISMRDANPPGSIPRFTAPTQEQKRNAGINVPTKRSTGLNPALASEAGARIDSKFERYKDRAAARSGMDGQRRDRLDRSRAFLVNLIDLGYAPSLVDSWCDDLLDDQIADGMPMDLVDSYWGSPVATQDFVEYDNPYELCTYLTAQGDYRQVTYNNRIVSQPTSATANVGNP